MNKNLKKIIAIAVAFGTVSAALPATNINLLTTKAYATSSDTEFDSLKILNKDDNEIKIYDDNSYASDNKLDNNEITSTGDYYIKTSSSTIRLKKSSNVSSKYIKVFKGTSGSTKGKSISDDISLTDDTTITVKIYSEDVSGETLHYDENKDDDNYSPESEYTIHVKYTGDSSSSDSSDSSDSSTSADDYDDIYLDKLTVDGENISLSDSKVAYSYSVPYSTSSVYIKALPSDEDNDTVSIDGYTVDDSDNYKKSVSLNVGANKFEIKTEDEDDNYRTYTLTINRAASATTNTNTATSQPSTTTGTTTTTTAKVGWVPVSGRWQYFDSFGRQYRSQWLYDINYGSWYYLGADGFMQTGWILDNGKYYYLNANGSMAHDTTIGGYKLGSDGAWIR